MTTISVLTIIDSMHLIRPDIKYSKIVFLTSLETTTL